MQLNSLRANQANKRISFKLQDMIHKRNDRPIIFIANSSWYLDHYRKELIKKCAEKNNVISISPIDKSIRNLSKISLHSSWARQN